jgi:hypothetical protein
MKTNATTHPPITHTPTDQYTHAHLEGVDTTFNQAGKEGVEHVVQPMVRVVLILRADFLVQRVACKDRFQ